MKMYKQSGQVIIGAAIAMVVLLGFAGLAIDMGTLRYQRRLQQMAADSAAIAGAQNLDFGSGVAAGAKYASSQNGFADGGTGLISDCDGAATVGTTCVQVLNPPADVTFNGGTIDGGPHKNGATNIKYVEVLVAKVQPTYFMNVFGVGSKTVVARAVATNITGGTNVSCMWTLGPPTSAIIGLDATGNAKILAPNCGIADNGNLDTVGNSYTIDAGTISVSGACIGAHCGSPDVKCEAYTNQTCPSLGGSPASSDPLCQNSATCIHAPSDPGYSSTCGGAVPCNWSSASNSTVTIEPGKYDSITIGKNSVVTMDPGTYYFNSTGANAGINMQGGGTLTSSGYVAGCTSGGVAVSGVMMYFNGTATMQKFVGGGNNPDLRLCPLSAAQSTTYQSMLIYQDPADTTTAWIGGDNNTVLYGTVYMPTATMTFYGNTTFSMLGQTIAYSVATTGNPTVTLGTSPSGLTPAWLTRPILVE